MRWAAIAAAIIAAADDIFYLGIVRSQGGGDPEFFRIPFVATFIAVMAICCALSVRASAARWRPLLLGVAAAGLLLLGFFAVFSIGLLLVVPGVLALLALIRTLRSASACEACRGSGGRRGDRRRCGPAGRLRVGGLCNPLSVERPGGRQRDYPAGRQLLVQLRQRQADRLTSVRCVPGSTALVSLVN